MEQYFIGLDYGSDSVRALLVDNHGHELASSVSVYQRWSEGKYCDAAHFQFRQHPQDYLDATKHVVRDVLAQRPGTTVSGIGIDTTGSTPCAVDRNGTPLALKPEFADDPDAMFLLWKDHTGMAEADRINEVAASWTTGPDYRMYCGGIYSCEWFWSKVLHVLRHSETVRNAAFSWVEHGDWMVGELTGNTDPLTMFRGRCGAGHKALWNAQWGGLPPEEFLTAVDPLLAGVRERLYTDTVTADHPAGHLTQAWADALGLSTDVVVAGSGIDCHVGAVGAHARPGKMVMVVGTSACELAVVPQIETCIRGICGQVDGSVVPGLTGLEAGQSSFGDVFAWFRRLLEWAGPVSLADLEREAAALPPGSNGILALDWFNGRRTPDADDHCRGAILGLNLGATAPMVYHALVESTALGTRAIIERFQEEGVPIDSIAALGGIARKSPMVMQTLADALNRPINIIASDQACALGAAMFGATACGAFKDIHEAMSAMEPGIEKTYFPDAQRAAAYNDLYAQYLKAGHALY